MTVAYSNTLNCFIKINRGLTNSFSQYCSESKAGLWWKGGGEDKIEILKEEKYELRLMEVKFTAYKIEVKLTELKW